MNLQKNVGGTDRLVRGVVGTALLVGAAFAAVSGAWLVSAGAGVLAAALLLNALTQFCGVNAVLGVNTCSAEEN